MNKEEFDRMFDESFDTAAKNHNGMPDPMNSWKQIESKMYRQRKRRQKLKLLPYLAASFLLGAVIFGTPVVSNAFNPFFQTIKNIQSDVVSFVFGSRDNHDTKPKTLPPEKEPDSTGSDISSGVKTRKKLATWDEAVPLLAIRPIMLNYVPKGYQMDEVLLFFKDSQNKSNEAVISYSDGTNSRFRVTFRLLEANETITSATHKDGRTVETIKLNGTDAFLVISNDDRSSLEFLLGNIYVSISGDLIKAEIIEIAKNIK
ncbi:DUF4367 domain-containing protein [Paenibacillus sp. NPDC056579]|uniref:DUF4367 domain-containing protein n=1 Tax=Paenibacillus sp. NPDC056579 TaxID=3345871 RepID=UPI003674A138